MCGIAIGELQVKPARETLLLGIRVPFAVKPPGFGMKKCRRDRGLPVRRWLHQERGVSSGQVFLTMLLRRLWWVWSAGV